MIEIIGKGQGAAKTDTVIHGITVTEDFGVSDELFVHWQHSDLIDATLDPQLHLEFAPVTSEVDKLFSLQINISVQGIGSDLTDVGEAFTITDIVLPATAFEIMEVRFDVPKRLLNTESKDDFHIRIRRIASSDDLAGDVALHHVSMEYQKHQV